MNNETNSKLEAIKLGVISIACWGMAAWALLTTTGCGAGYELGGKIGVYEIDERNQQETTTAKTKPFVCRFRQCDPAGNVIQGS